VGLKVVLGDLHGWYTVMAQANAFAERWVRTVRSDCLDWTLVWNERQLQQIMTEYLGTTTPPDHTAPSICAHPLRPGH
jgi:hypothetical protein